MCYFLQDVYLLCIATEISDNCGVNIAMLGIFMCHAPLHPISSCLMQYSEILAFTLGQNLPYLCMDASFLMVMDNKYLQVYFCMKWLLKSAECIISHKHSLFY